MSDITTFKLEQFLDYLHKIQDFKISLKDFLEGLANNNITDSDQYKNIFPTCGICTENYFRDNVYFNNRKTCIK